MKNIRRDDSRLARTSDDYFHRDARLCATKEREEGSRLVLSGLHNATRLPPFSISRRQSRGCIRLLMTPPRDMVTFLFRIVSVIVTMFTGCVHDTQMETARGT